VHHFVDKNCFAPTDSLKPRLLKAGAVDTLMPLTQVNIPAEVQGNAAAALGNLATKGMFA
jgi:hypothetical protein